MLRNLAFAVSNSHAYYHDEHCVYNAATATATAGIATSYRHQLESTSVVVEWICGFMKSKIVDLIDKLEIFVLKTLQSLTEERTPTLTLDNMLEEKLRSSLLLSVVILLIVVVTRSMEDDRYSLLNSIDVPLNANLSSF